MSDRKYQQKIKSMLFEIGRILNTKNLMPRELQKFFAMESYLKSTLNELDTENYEGELKIEAWKRLEKDLDPIVGEIYRYEPGLLNSPQFGGAKVYGEEKPGVVSREFESNINYNMDREGVLPDILNLDRPKKL